MSRAIRTLLVAGVIALIAAACGDDGDTDAASLDDARDAFCADAETLVATLDTYGMVLGDQGLTVGAVRSNGEDLAAARADVEASAATLQEAIEAAEEAGDDVPDELDVDEETIQFVRDAEEAFDDALDGVSDDTLLVDAAVVVTSAAFQYEIAWIALLEEAGCLEDGESFAAEVIDYVKAVQTDLAAAGYYEGEIDGIYGPETIGAVEALQEAAGLPVTGLMDPATQAALADELAGQESAQIAALQGLMVATGYYPGPIDGVANDALDAAVKQLQADAGLEANGVIDAATLRAIQLAVAANAPVESTTTTEDPSTSTTADPSPSSSTEAPPSTTSLATTSTTEAPADPTILDVLRDDERFSTLVDAIEAAGLTDLVEGEGPVTLFAPTNDAFEQLPDGTLDDLLLPENTDELAQLLSYHGAQGALTAEDIVAAGQVETLLESEPITVTTDDDGNVVLNGDQATVEEADLVASNGLIHAIDGVLSAP
jgi:uncharacterized surface protein with fasciclin (FAS1) repeats